MLLYWIWFSLLKNLPLWKKKAMLQYFSDPEEIYFADPAAFEKVPDMTEDTLKALEEKDLQESEKILNACGAKNIGVLPLADSRYPERLRNIDDPPVVLYYRGVLPEWDAQPFIGVVGTRKATAYGLQQAFRLGKQISQCGGVVVSGGAFGIDSKSMQGAIEAERPVVGVLGCGVDVVYPRTNRHLFNRTAEYGCLLSEYPPGEAPLPWHFPQRNRIISGICHGVLVVEAPQKSGALITAQFACQQGRDVYAVPANLGVDAYEGNNGLLAQGFPAVRDGWDAVKAYENLYPQTVAKYSGISPSGGETTPLKVAQKPVIPEKVQKISIDNREKSTYSVINSGGSALTEEERKVLALISRHPVHSDTVAENSELPPSKVQSILTKLTLKGLVQHHSGGRVSLK